MEWDSKEKSVYINTNGKPIVKDQVIEYKGFSYVLEEGDEYKPKGNWNGEASGALNVSIDNPESAINGATVKEGTNDPVIGEVTSATRNPILTGTIIRSDFGDDPDSYYASNSKNPVVKSLLSTFEGVMQRPWKYTYNTPEPYIGEDGETHYKDVEHEETGTSTGEFVPGENLVTVTTRIYSGSKSSRRLIRHTKRL